MAAYHKPSEPEIPDNHKESWMALLSAAEAYCQKSGCDLAILTACKKFRFSTGDSEGVKKREGSVAFPREFDFSYNVWGHGFLAESARRYMDDIAVLHSTSMLTAQKQTRPAAEERGAKQAADLTSDPGHRGVSGPFVLNAAQHVSAGNAVAHKCESVLMLQSGTGELGGVSPNGRLFSQSYPSIYSSVTVSGGAKEQNGNGERERERSSLEAERERQRAGIVDLEEECEDEEEDEDDMDERQPYGNESAGET